jgi:HAD superfamily hydrolase (TIGR01662 family)
MVRKDTSMCHPGLVPVRPGRGPESRRARSRDLFTDLHLFRVERHSPAISVHQAPHEGPFDPRDRASRKGARRLPGDIQRPARVTALTFDLWNTLYSANSGYDKVRAQRMHAIRQLLAMNGVHPSDDEMWQTYHSGTDAYVAAWEGGRHFGARDQILHFLDRFGLDPTALDDDSIAATVLEIENAAVLASLELLPGVRETIPALASAGYRLGIISDTSLTTGRILRSFLKKDGFLDCFAVLTFSDETGYPKPDRRMFESTLVQLGAEPSQAMHVGDTPRTDIAGAKAMGMTTIRCAGSTDHEEPPEADYVIRDHREIPAILEQLA